MTHLPYKILAEIFSYLHRIEIEEGRLVCKHWKQAIEELVLYQTVILRSMSNLTKLTEKMQQDRSIASRIKHLMLFFPFNNRDNLNNFLLSFPNLQTLSTSNDLRRGVHSAAVNKEIQYPFHKEIEHIEDEEDNPASSVTRHLLSFSLCPKLTILEIGLDKNFIPLLKNAPALKKLISYRAAFDFRDFDKIHNSVPCLQSFQLRMVNIRSIEYVIHKTIPATTVTQFAISGAGVQEPSLTTNLLMYISKKYPNLSELDFKFSCPGFQTEDRNGNGWYTFFQNAGAQFKKLTIDHNATDIRIFEMFNKFELQIEHFETLRKSFVVPTNIVRARHIHFIKVLSFVYENNLDCVWLNEFQVLESLTVVGADRYSSIVLTDIMIHFPPSLKSLAFLLFQSLKVDPEYTGISHLNSLTFTAVNLPEMMDSFIDHHFPSLSKLSFAYCNLEGRIWHLPTIKLLYFQFENVRPDYDLLINTTGDTHGSRLYSLRQKSFNQRLETSERLYRSYPANEMNSTPFFTVNCYSFKKIEFLKFEVPF